MRIKKFNKIIISLILLFLTFGVLSLVNSQNCNNDYVLIELNYGESISVVEKTLERGCIPDYQHDAGFRYSYELIGDNISLYEADFNPEFLYYDGISEETSITGKVVSGEDIERDIIGGADIYNENFFIKVPSVKEGEKVNLYDNETKILEIDVYSVGATSCRI